MAISNGKGMTVDYVPGKNMVKSAKVGAATPDEIKWLTSQLVAYSNKFKAAGWVYIVDISKMSPTTPDVSAELVNMTKAILGNGCKGMAFVQGGAFMTTAQAQQHQKESKSTVKEGYFRTEEEAIKWASTII